MPATVAVLVLSYNRPRMLAEALATVTAADQVLLVDDGSDFNVLEVASRFPLKNLSLVSNYQISVEERLTLPRVGSLINRALTQVTCDVCAYLCDDDLFTPEWIPALQTFFGSHPEVHMVRGEWRKFQDGEPLSRSERLEHPDWRQMTCGNFAHRTVCFREEGVLWDERKIAVHDDAFLWRMHKVHPLETLTDLNIVAGYRRLHAFNCLPFTIYGGRYAESARAVLEQGWMEETP